MCRHVLYGHYYTASMRARVHRLSQGIELGSELLEFVLDLQGRALVGGVLLAGRTGRVGVCLRGVSGREMSGGGGIVRVDEEGANERTAGGFSFNQRAAMTYGRSVRTCTGY